MVVINPSKNPFLEDGNQAPLPVNKASTTSQSASSPLTPSESIKPESFFSSPSVAPRTFASDSRRRRWWWVLIILLLVFLIGAGGYFWFRADPAEPETEKIDVRPESLQPNVLPKTSEPNKETAPFMSENFKVGEIVIGGEAEFFLNEDAIAPLTISGIRGEAFTEKNKQEVKLVVTWKSNRLSLATIEYSKGIGQSGKSVSENDYSFNHSVIITGLDPATTYLYTIKAEDRFGNVTQSDPHAVFTGARTVSLFDLIAGAIGEVFGWAVDK